MSKVVRLTNATLDVLEVLAGGDVVYGLQISARVNRPTGTIYPLLARLESLGWLQATWESDERRGRGPRRRYYQLTPVGQEQAASALRRRDPAASAGPAASGSAVPAASSRTEKPAVASPEPAPGERVSAEQVVRAFATALRALRADAGHPSLRAISTWARYSPAAVFDALSGRGLPTLPLVLAIVRACGGDPEEWQRRRILADQSIRLATWIPWAFEDFYPMGVEWVDRRLRLADLNADDRADVSQDVLLAVLQLWPDLSLISDLREWVSWRTDRLVRARESSASTRPLRLDERYERDSRTCADAAEAVVARTAARDLAGRLDPQTARMAFLRGHGYELREIADLLGVSRAAVESRLSRARHRIGLDAVTQERERYTAYLVHLRSEAGTPALRQIGTRIRYSHTHIASVLSGAQIPTWEFTERYVRALGGSLDTAWELWLNSTGRDAQHADDWVRAAARTGDMFTLWKLADQSERHGRTDQAAQVWRVAAQLGNRDAMVVMADLLDRQGKLKEAEQWLRHATKAGEPMAKQLLTHLLERTGQVDEALELWRRDSSQDGMHQLTRILERAGRVDEALAVWRWSADGRNTATRELAGMLNRHGRTKEAIALWEEACRAGSFWALREFATHIVETAGDRLARHDVRQVLRSWSPEARRELATLLEQMGHAETWRETLHGNGEPREQVAHDDSLDDSLELWQEPDGGIQTTAERYTIAQKQILARLIDTSLVDLPLETLLHRAPGGLADAQPPDGEEQRLHELAEAGDYRAARRLAEHLTEHGRTTEAIAVLQAPAASGNSDAAWRLAQLLADEGHLADLRVMADNGSDYAGWLLVARLARAKDWPQLHELAQARGRPYAPYAAERLAATDGPPTEET
ncbi:hypothetical protein Aph01nite_72800 [Acrocarpospora phusangensis]|uniref:HTH cro/C1-type domain-containing protein n=1 Tax=Acrocarpospora phusangensis TaxID=1070424 RepID=A0A919UV19_9ACTN|nr:helix-turn-helix transcriptional regulator [Acrocarpospora phusangensis]GIH28970.1 hypothetical protein Aph01nite_72800 [Acrocarpospora phusangensis]